MPFAYRPARLTLQRADERLIERQAVLEVVPGRVDIALILLHSFFEQEPCPLRVVADKALSPRQCAHHLDEVGFALSDQLATRQQVEGLRVDAGARQHEAVARQRLHRPVREGFEGGCRVDDLVPKGRDDLFRCQRDDMHRVRIHPVHEQVQVEEVVRAGPGDDGHPLAGQIVCPRDAGALASDELDVAFGGRERAHDREVGARKAVDHHRHLRRHRQRHVAIEHQLDTAVPAQALARPHRDAFVREESMRFGDVERQRQ